MTHYRHQRPSCAPFVAIAILFVLAILAVTL
ncbi:MAG: hypothetical protein QG584_2553 [Pseudomonadota bacterium]|nr:hypothetical protein [Pseudomonadota bacterium]